MYQTKLKANKTGDFEAIEFDGVEVMVLHTNENTGAMTVVTRMDPGATIPAHSHTCADESVYVLEGELIEDGEVYARGSFLRGVRQTVHGPHYTEKGCVLLTYYSFALDFVLAEEV